MMRIIENQNDIIQNNHHQHLSNHENLFKKLTKPIDNSSSSSSSSFDTLKNYSIAVLFTCIFIQQILSLLLLTTAFLTGLICLIVGLASVGASFGLRRMYVKALLKLFEYATNIKQEKIKDCEELLPDDDGKSEHQKQKDRARLHRLRLESFILDPPSHSSSNSSSSASLTSLSSPQIDTSDIEPSKYLDDIDKQNNNYMSPASTQKSSSNLDITTKQRSYSDIKRDFQLSDICDFVHKGLEAIIDDEVTKRFTTEELTVWNLLSRTNQQYEYVSFRVTVLWLMGLIIRYCILFPFRLVLFILACFYTFVSTFIIGHFQDGRFKRWLNWYGTLILHRILSRVFSAIITFHNRENRAKPGSICVANHTSPIDVIILSTDNAYSMIGQQHGGFTGMMQKAFSRASRHIWFDRSEAKDRGLVAKRMRDHIQDKNNMPILIFPEGTCINNTSVMMFKKGCFEVDTTIYPVAIKYDLRFGDAFWNSSKHTMLQYLILMMTSWAIVVDVYYLPAMNRNPDEDAAQFASRVKSEIVKKGSFVDLHWDGMLKRTAPKLDLMYEQQQKYVSQLKIEQLPSQSHEKKDL